MLVMGASVYASCESRMAVEGYGEEDRLACPFQPDKREAPVLWCRSCLLSLIDSLRQDLRLWLDADAAQAAARKA
jgi:hypothetical protein